MKYPSADDMMDQILDADRNYAFTVTDVSYGSHFSFAKLRYGLDEVTLGVTGGDNCIFEIMDHPTAETVKVRVLVDSPEHVTPALRGLVNVLRGMAD